MPHLPAGHPAKGWATNAAPPAALAFPSLNWPGPHPEELDDEGLLDDDELLLDDEELLDDELLLELEELLDDAELELG